MKTGCIYRIYHKTTMKSYIGKTIHPKRRIANHLSGNGGAVMLCNAINKHGKDSFVIEILEKDIPEYELTKMEMFYIHFFNSKKPNGYNLTDGGEGPLGVTPWNKGETGIYSDETLRSMSESRKGRKQSAETRRKISITMKGRKPWNTGKTNVFSHETRQAISDAMKGRTISTETRKRISQVHKGKKVSEETRKKISETKKERNKRQKSKLSK